MISVVIPTMNDEKAFDTVRSVLDQSYDNFEVIVVDGSSGAHQESLESFCKENDVKYLHEKDYSHEPCLNGARNLGIENSEGQIIALIDGDCVAKEAWLENLVNYFENHDIVECNVKYVSEGRKCPMDRAIQNDGRNYGFLGAGLAFKKEVWDRDKFDEELHFHDDTAFGLNALENNFSYTYGEQARIEHHAGRFSALQFMRERMRFEHESVFFKKFRDNQHLEKEVNHIGPVLHPKELAILGALIVSIGVIAVSPQVGGLMILGIMAATTSVYVKREADKRDLEFCPLDLLKLFFLVPFTFILVKRYAIWKGSLKNRIPVI